ncbi:MAG: restriction endonuclease [Thermoproteota archaeon]|nr:restriction endonuclease [Thermoproteota archaeon]
MRKNTGVPYELLTRMIFDAILNQDWEGVNNVDVKHDVTLAGLKTTHQIDVYWEFEVGGIRYATVVQAKDWMKVVDQGELLKFNGVLTDLPSQPRGVFVTRTGYQEGALNYARAEGILLYELRESTDSDRKGRMLSVNVDLSSYLSHTTQVQLIPDDRWVYGEIARLQLNEVLSIRFGKELEEVILFDESGNGITTLKKLTDSFYPSGYMEVPPTRVRHEFTEPAFIETGVAEFPRLKVNAVEATIAVNRVDQEIRLTAGDIVGFILKNVIDGSERIFDREGKILG